MRKLLSYVFLLSILAIAGCQTETSTLEPSGEAAESSSTYKRTESDVEIKNRYFKYIPLKNSNGISDIILDVTHTANYKSGELMTGNFQITAKDLLTEDPLWTVEFDAHQESYEFGYIKAYTPGTGSQEDTYRLFSLLTGKEIASYSNSEMRIGIPNSPDKRILGFVSQNAQMSLPDEDNLLGILTYASNDQTIEKIKVKAVDAAAFKQIQPFTPDMEFGDYDENNKVTNAGKGLILWNADQDYTSEDVSNIVVILTFFHGEEFKPIKVYIPIEDDRFDLKKVLHKEDLIVIEDFPS